MEELAVVGGLALADAINPTSLGIGLYLLLHHNYVHKLLVFVAGLFVTYFLFGVALELGVARHFLELWGERHPATVAVSILIGGAMVVYGLLLGRRPKRRRKALQERSIVSLPSAFALGGLATLMDLPTAFPYLGAITVIGRLELTYTQVVLVLFVYNLVVILPLIVLLLVRVRTHRHSEAVVRRLQRKVFAWERLGLRILLIALGIVFMLDSLRLL